MSRCLLSLNFLYKLGWEDSLFVVDDNFIGNKRDAMQLLPAVKQWQEERQFPFSLYTEASVNLVEIPEMLDAMSEAGFGMVFLGIESPNDEALLSTSKGQNTSKEEEAGSYLLRAVRKIQSKGIEVTGGFIIGLDGDTEFDSHINFIQEAGIPAAIAGLLNALKETDLWHRLKQENRLLVESTGNSTDLSLNFIPEIPRETLIAEYQRVVSTLYDPTLKNYFARCLTLLEHMPRTSHNVKSIRMEDLRTFARSIRRQLFSRHGLEYARYLLKALKNYPDMFAGAVRLAIMGYHFEKLTRHTIAVGDFRDILAFEMDAFKEKVSQCVQVPDTWIGQVQKYSRHLFARMNKAYDSLHDDFRYGAHDTFANFQKSAFKEYLDAELNIFKMTVSTFQKAQPEGSGELQTSVRHLFARVRVQYAQLHDDFKQDTLEIFDAFHHSVKQELEQFLDTISVQAERLT